jgi:hypothetical protein
MRNNSENKGISKLTSFETPFIKDTKDLDLVKVLLDEQKTRNKISISKYPKQISQKISDLKKLTDKLKSSNPSINTKNVYDLIEKNIQIINKEQVDLKAQEELFSELQNIIAKLPATADRKNQNIANDVREAIGSIKKSVDKMNKEDNVKNYEDLSEIAKNGPKDLKIEAKDKITILDSLRLPKAINDDFQKVHSIYHNYLIAYARYDDVVKNKIDCEMNSKDVKPMLNKLTTKLTELSTELFNLKVNYTKFINDNLIQKKLLSKDPEEKAEAMSEIAKYHSNIKKTLKNAINIFKNPELMSMLAKFYKLADKAEDAYKEMLDLSRSPKLDFNEKDALEESNLMTLSKNVENKNEKNTIEPNKGPKSSKKKTI